MVVTVIRIEQQTTDHIQEFKWLNVIKPNNKPSFLKLMESLSSIISIRLTMLGEQILEFKGKSIGQRVLDVEGPTIETSVSVSGSIKGTQVKETLTFEGRPITTTPKGVLRGKGKWVIMDGESELATYTGEWVGRVSSSGSINYRGSIFYKYIIKW